MHLGQRRPDDDPLGFAEDRRVRKLFAWLLEDQREDGGWNCSQGTPGTLDVWEPLAAFAALPRTARSAEMERSIARGAEFYLKRGLLREGRPYSPWTRTHYPNYYFYDFLVGLEVLTRLGYGGDRRLKPALSILKKTRRGDGRWLLGRSHPGHRAAWRFIPTRARSSPSYSSVRESPASGLP